jgi:predicted  nucleic acid-binding Zn-ribbon protein
MDFHATLSHELGALAERLATAAKQELDAATTACLGERTRLASERDALRTRLQDVTTSRDAVEAQVAALTTQLNELTKRTATLTSQVAELDAARSQLRARADELAASNEALALELARAASEREAAAGAHAQELARLRDELATVRTAEQEARNALSGEMAARAGVSREMAQLRAQLGSATDSYRDRLADHLAAVVAEMDMAGSVDEVLSAAANGLTSAFTRVAVIGVTGGQLEPRYERGFEHASDIERARVPVGDASLLGRAAASGDLGVVTVDALTELPFGGSPGLIVTAPVVVRGELLAVIYADTDGIDPESSSGPTPARVADVVRRHASLRLDRLTLDLKTMGELRGYARMLLDEVEYVYRADVSAHKPDDERVARLRENVRCARQIYQQRVAVEGPAMGSLLDDVIATAIAAKASTPFGRELSAVASESWEGVGAAG